MIGGTCKRGNAFSGPVLIARGLDFEHRVWSYGVLRVRGDAQRPDNFGGHSGRETPLPIPNREVKPACADGTRRATSRESRQPPINFLERPRSRGLSRFSPRARRLSEPHPFGTAPALRVERASEPRRRVNSFPVRSIFRSAASIRSIRRGMYGLGLDRRSQRRFASSVSTMVSPSRQASPAASSRVRP